MNQIIHTYNKTNPFLATITERYSLCHSESDKSTIHITLSLKGSGITYQVGDSMAIHPLNNPEIVQRVLKAINATGHEIITSKRTEESFSLYDYLTKKANLSSIPRKLISEISERQTNQTKKERLQFILEESQKEAFKEYQATHEVWDMLENEEIKFDPQELCNLLMPLLPRFYSIASAMSTVGEEVHLTVAELSYEAGGYVRRGTCTHYLCHLAPMHEAIVPIYIQPSNGFNLPDEGDHPIIMIGPGTGVAPFRAFMQERQTRGHKGFNWLFFGERKRAHHYYYEDYWQDLVQKNILRVDTAFSRDQEHKIYVQHRLVEFGDEIFAWLEKGAYLYVCGDAQRMAKDVDMALHSIVQSHGQRDEQGAKEYIKKLKQEKRYLRDVY